LVTRDSRCIRRANLVSPTRRSRSPEAMGGLLASSAGATCAAPRGWSQPAMMSWGRRASEPTPRWRAGLGRSPHNLPLVISDDSSPTRPTHARSLVCASGGRSAGAQATAAKLCSGGFRTQRRPPWRAPLAAGLPGCRTRWQSCAAGAGGARGRSLRRGGRQRRSAGALKDRAPGGGWGGGGQAGGGGPHVHMSLRM